MSVYEWLRIGNRTQIVFVVLAVLSFLALGLANVACCTDDSVYVEIVMACNLAFTLIVWIPTYLYVRWKQKGTARASRPEGNSQLAAWSRLRLYALLALVTLIFALGQYYRLDIRVWPLGHSLSTIFLSNFAILGIVIATNEVLQRRRH
jgi:hypothetical protein